MNLTVIKLISCVPDKDKRSLFFRDIAKLNKADSYLLLDASNLKYLHSDEIAALINLNGEIKNKGRELVLCSASKYIRQIFNLLSISNEFIWLDNSKDYISKHDWLSIAHLDIQVPT
jgi:anti-anti-sigma regulatory factor